jgi:hypothetical protein
MAQNEGRLTEEDIQVACNVLRRIQVQSSACSCACARLDPFSLNLAAVSRPCPQTSTELNEAEKPALSCVTSWLSSHLPVCQDEEANSPKAELLQSQCFPIVEAFQAVYRHSTRVSGGY